MNRIEPDPKTATRLLHIDFDIPVFPRPWRTPPITRTAIWPGSGQNAAIAVPQEDFLPFARLVSAAATKVPDFSDQMLLYDLFTINPNKKEESMKSEVYGIKRVDK